MSKPLFIAISDVHFNLNNLYLASASLQTALYKAEELNVPLVIAGDLNDTKAIIRAEVANAIIRILKPAKVKVMILEGNHDKVNEKGDEHGLNYLSPYASIIDTPYRWKNVVFIPYQSYGNKIEDILEFINPNKGDIIVMHQGFHGAFMGDYIQDKSSISADVVKNYKVISGHYHRHQTLDTVTYIGSPYTITFGEANDGPKGFLVVNKDGTYTREILNLRKHIVIERTIDRNMELPVNDYNQGDLLKVKLRGPKELLKLVNREKLGKLLIGHSNFKLDLIPSEVESSVMTPFNKYLSDPELMVQLINAHPEYHDELYALYIKVLNEIN